MEGFIEGLVWVLILCLVGFTLLCAVGLAYLTWVIIRAPKVYKDDDAS